MKRTYIDANVLIAAFNGKGQGAQNALRILDDPERKLVVSDYLRLEVLPKPTFHRRQEEVEFMREVFDSAAEHLDTSPELTGRALALAAKYGCQAVALCVDGRALRSKDFPLIE